MPYVWDSDPRHPKRPSVRCQQIAPLGLSTGALWEAQQWEPCPPGLAGLPAPFPACPRARFPRRWWKRAPGSRLELLPSSQFAVPKVSSN